MNQKKLKDAVQSMNDVAAAAKKAEPADHLRALREWRMAATLRFTGKSLAVATGAKGRGK